MKNYEIKLELTGAMTQVPDSQKLFGALVYLFAETYGDEKATALTKAVLDKKIHLALSNVLPEGYLPVPQDYLIDKLSENSNEELDLKKVRSAIKLRSYIKSCKLQSVLDAPEKCENIYPYVKQQNLQQLRASIDSLRYDLPELDTRLYSVPTVDLCEVSQDKDDKGQNWAVKNFCFYLQADDRAFCSDFLNLLQSAAEENLELILGKRASQGLNRFRVKGITEQKLPTLGSDNYINTGMLLPDHIDFQASSMRLFTSERRPFEMMGGWSEDSPKYYISYLAQGSIIAAPEGAEKAGKSIQSPFNSRSIVFGNAFLYPIILRERQV